MESKYIIGIIAVSLVTVWGVSFVAANGFGNGFMNSDLTDEEKAELQAEHEAIKTAVRNGDYETWKSLIDGRISRMQEQITEENFNKLHERQQNMEQFKEAVNQAKEDGTLDKEKLQELQTEYGIEGMGFGKGFKKGFGNGFGKGFRQGFHEGELGNCPYAHAE